MYYTASQPNACQPNVLQTKAVQPCKHLSVVVDIVVLDDVAAVVVVAALKNHKFY